MKTSSSASQESLFRLAIEASPTGMMMIDDVGRISLVNAQIEKLFGYDRAELIGQPMEMLVPDRFRKHHPGFRTAFFRAPQTRSMGSGRDLYGLRKDGTEVPIEIGLNPLTTPQGSFVLSSIADITERKRAEERQASLREKETLLKEIHHRVKNNLQVISSLLSLQSRHIPDARSSLMLQESQDRIYSIALVHEQLYQTNNVESVSFAEYLDVLVGHLNETWSGSRGKTAVDIRVQPAGFRMPIDLSVPCGLIVNELVTNALKHAFPGDQSGMIKITVESDSALGLTISVQDDGVGMSPEIDLHKPGSMGLELVTTLARQIRGQIDIQRNGGTLIRIFISKEKNDS